MVGVYKITNPIGQVYVGSSKNIEERWRAHKSLLRKHHRKLIESFENYGIENHKFEVIVECTKDQLNELETFYGLKLNALDRKKGLNLMLPKLNDGSGGCSEDKITWNKGKKGVQKGWNKGKKISEETKKKISNSNKGQTPWNKGIPLTKETKEKLSESLKGRKVWNKGKKWSEESKKKMSESSKGSIAWNRVTVLDVNTGVFYNSITEASFSIEIERRKLIRMIKKGHEIGKRIKILN